jgi:hypothetical protein
LTGPDFLSGGALVEVPKVLIYTGGFECQDLSTLNVNHKTLSGFETGTVPEPYLFHVSNVRCEMK